MDSAFLVSILRVCLVTAVAPPIDRRNFVVISCALVRPRLCRTTFEKNNCGAPNRMRIFGDADETSQPHRNRFVYQSDTFCTLFIRIEGKSPGRDAITRVRRNEGKKKKCRIGRCLHTIRILGLVNISSSPCEILVCICLCRFASPVSRQQKHKKKTLFSVAAKKE